MAEGMYDVGWVSVGIGMGGMEALEGERKVEKKE